MSELGFYDFRDPPLTVPNPGAHFWEVLTLDAVDDLELLDEQRVNADCYDGAEIRDKKGDQPEPAPDTEWAPGTPIYGSNQPE